MARFSARVVHGKLSVPGGQVGDPGTWTFSGGLRCAPRGAEWARGRFGDL